MSASESLQDVFDDDDGDDGPDGTSRPLLANLIKNGGAVALIVGTLAVIGFSVSLQTVIVLFVLLFGLGIVVETVGEVSVPFVLSFLIVLGLVTEFFLPASILGLFQPLVAFGNSLIGFDVRQLDAAQFAAMGVLALVVIWFIDIRISSAFRRESGRPEAKRPDKIAKRMRSRAEDLANIYVQMGVVLLGFALSVVTIGLDGIADFGTEVFEVLAGDPVLSAGIFSNLAGYLSLGGSLPIVEDIPILSTAIGALGNLGPVGYGLLAGSLLMIAVFARDQ